MWFRPVSTPDRIRTGATALRGRRARPLHNGGLDDPELIEISTPDRIRTGATALRGQRARPLHNGGFADELCELAYLDSNQD